MHTHEKAFVLRAWPVGWQVRAPWIGLQLHHQQAFSQLCSAALYPTSPSCHHLTLDQVHRRVDRNASDALEEWMSRLVAPHPTSFSSHPPTILPIPAICRTFPLGFGSKG